ncbi:MAG: transporter [Acidobacteria bacterium]|nr:transporter [Acidobacteriota bacterium]
MKQCRYVILVALVGLATAGAACTQKAADETFADATGDVAKRTVDKTKEIAGKAADKATETASDIATKTKDLAATTGEAITDTWITAKVSAKFVDETLLNGSHINVDTNNHIVTLRGTVASAAAKGRAGAIASGTEGVTRVVNQLVVT